MKSKHFILYMHDTVLWTKAKYIIYTFVIKVLKFFGEIVFQLKQKCYGIKCGLPIPLVKPQTFVRYKKLNFSKCFEHYTFNSIFHHTAHKYSNIIPIHISSSSATVRFCEVNEIVCVWQYNSWLSSLTYVSLEN